MTGCHCCSSFCPTYPIALSRPIHVVSIGTFVIPTIGNRDEKSRTLSLGKRYSVSASTWNVTRGDRGRPTSGTHGMVGAPIFLLKGENARPQRRKTICQGLGAKAFLLAGRVLSENPSTSDLPPRWLNRHRHARSRRRPIRSHLVAEQQTQLVAVDH